MKWSIRVEGLSDGDWALVENAAKDDPNEGLSGDVLALAAMIIEKPDRHPQWCEEAMVLLLYAKSLARERTAKSNE